jgi:hypothetical protein
VTQDQTQWRKIIEGLLAPASEVKQQAISIHETLRKSAAYQNGLAYNRRVCSDFIKLIHLVSIMATRNQDLPEYTHDGARESRKNRPGCWMTQSAANCSPSSSLGSPSTCQPVDTHAAVDKRWLTAVDGRRLTLLGCKTSF